MDEGIIWVVGGTADSRWIIKRLLEDYEKVVVTVTTKFGKELITKSKGLEVNVLKLNHIEMVKFIKEKNISYILDASHPFAVEVSKEAIKASELTGVKYVRYERKEEQIHSNEKIVRVDTFERAAYEANNIEGNILLTTGSNNVDVFINHIKEFKERLFVRVLPDSNVLKKCESLGLGAKNIIAMKGPFSKQMNMEILKHCRANALVTKNSGNCGGVIEKIDSAISLEKFAIVINRPFVNYPKKIHTIEEILKEGEEE